MSGGRRSYPFHVIEPKWQSFWAQQETFRAWNPGETLPQGHPFQLRHGSQLPPKYYILDMFPYPSGAGLHVGHPEGYTATDILARYRRARGYNVLHPMGWDAFGLPAEQYAIKTGQHPRITTEANVTNFKRQIQSLGFSYDWSREVNTTDPGYFKWSQWIFLQLYNSWFNPDTRKAESIETLKYPADCSTEEARRDYRDQHRLAFVSEAPVNWCPELGTVLANEEVVDGKSEVGGFPVVRKPMRQWMLRITAFAQRLLDDLEAIDWSPSLKEMQRNWIGRSEGAEVHFTLHGHDERVTVFTTRPDTLFGATYMVLSPEHPLVQVLTTEAQAAAVQAYREAAARKSDLERTELAKDKTGVFTGAYAINPVNGEKIPVWVADYVLISYGTGAIMAVPGHDERDLEFARTFDLPVREVVRAPEGTESIGFTGIGVAVNSGFLDGKSTPEAKQAMIQWLEEKSLGNRKVQFKLRDWLFSRQRYWGEPFPIVWKDGHHEALPEEALPLLPPTLDDYKPTADGEPPLARATDWLHLPDGSRRETNTMPQWAGSCWYYLRYLDATNPDRFCSPEAERYWMGTAGETRDTTPGVDLYVGGTEHAVLHLLYARFWHKVLFDLGHVSTPEPFFKLVNQGLILGELEFNAFADESGTPVCVRELKDLREEASSAGRRMVGTRRSDGAVIGARRVNEDEVEKQGDAYVLKALPQIRVDARSFKMSKSRGNVVNPDDVLQAYGADAFRLYEMFMGPLEMVKPWSTKNVDGVYRFLGRVWRLFVDENAEAEMEQNLTAAPDRAQEWLNAVTLHASIQEIEPSADQLKALHACIRKVTEDLDSMRFNTAISAMMVFVNEATGWATRPAGILRTFLQLLQPFAPHLAEELASKLPEPAAAGTLAYEPWPVYDPAVLVEKEVVVVLQVNGKVRARLSVPADLDKASLERMAMESEDLKPHLEGKTVRKVIVVPGKLVNIAVS